MPSTTSTCRPPENACRSMSSLAFSRRLRSSRPWLEARPACAASCRARCSMRSGSPTRRCSSLAQARALESSRCSGHAAREDRFCRVTASVWCRISGAGVWGRCASRATTGDRPCIVLSPRADRSSFRRHVPDAPAPVARFDPAGVVPEGFATSRGFGPRPPSGRSSGSVGSGGTRPARSMAWYMAPSLCRCSLGGRRVTAAPR